MTTFVKSQLLQEFECPVCLLVCKKVVNCQNCENMFCEDCSKTFKKCAICHENFIAVKNVYASRII